MFWVFVNKLFKEQDVWFMEFVMKSLVTKAMDANESIVISSL